MPTAELRLEPSYTRKELTDSLCRASGLSRPHYRILSKSLDARNRKFIHYLVRVEYDAVPLPERASCTIPRLSRPPSVTVVGMGPAGYFAALCCAMAGCSVTVLEQGKEVSAREKDIASLEETGLLDPYSNYLYGEGGAGTFSDGKLTSRTKSIRPERDFIYRVYVDAGAPEEIVYLSRPHVGSDILRLMMPKLRNRLLSYGATIHFGTQCTGFSDEGTVITSNGDFTTDYIVFAPGHSSYDTYRMLIRSGVSFSSKECAIGVRVEHPQAVINRAQWGREQVFGLTAAEYQLSYNDGDDRVYSFCMCPGGEIVPAARTPYHTGVNGASRYARSGNFANAAIVSSFNMDRHRGKRTDPLETLDYFELLQHSLYERSGSLAMPANTIEAFIRKRTASALPYATYPCSVYTDSFDGLLDEGTCGALRRAMRYFSKKMKGFGTGTLVGTELTSSAPVQVSRDVNGRADGYQNVYVCGEAGGFAGGIISSAADGMRAALDIVSRHG
ncbi:MAG: NAD(P)/FAD-dependent oxidoreductase [Spirochaetota bacterium]